MFARHDLRCWATSSTAGRAPSASGVAGRRGLEAPWLRPDSGRHADVVVQELRGDVLVVGPDKRLELGIHAKLAKERQVAQRSEGIAVKLGAQVNLAGSAVAEAQ